MTGCSAGCMFCMRPNKHTSSARLHLSTSCRHAKIVPSGFHIPTNPFLVLMAAIWNDYISLSGAFPLQFNESRVFYQGKKIKLQTMGGWCWHVQMHISLSRICMPISNPLMLSTHLVDKFYCGQCSLGWRTNVRMCVLQKSNLRLAGMRLLKLRWRQTGH